MGENKTGFHDLSNYTTEYVKKEDYLKVVEENERLKINSNDLFKLTKFISEERACYGRAGELSVDIAIDVIKTLEKEKSELKEELETQINNRDWEENKANKLEKVNKSLQYQVNHHLKFKNDYYEKWQSVEKENERLQSQWELNSHKNTELIKKNKELEKQAESLRMPTKYFYTTYSSFVDAGFSEEQSFELVKETFITGLMNN